jgi:sulfate permease
MEVLTLLAAGFFALNIGASGTAASMGAAYGGGAVSRRTAVWLVAAAVFAGAFGGGRVTATLGSGIVPEGLLTAQEALVILGSASATLFVANLLGIPLSTSEVTVGAIVGIGVAAGVLNWGRILLIVSAWVLVPLVAFGMAFLLGRAVQVSVERRLPAERMSPRLRATLAGVLVVTGVYEAVAAGMNNVANAVGPLVGAGLVTVSRGLVLGGLCVAGGALTLGARVLETNARRITALTPVAGCCVSFTSGTLVIAASLLGLPVPLTQATTAAIVGVGWGRGGRRSLVAPTVRRIAQVWILSPTVSLVLAYSVAVAVVGGYGGSLGRTAAVVGVLVLSALAAVYAGRKKFSKHRSAMLTS